MQQTTFNPKPQINNVIEAFNLERLKTLITEGDKIINSTLTFHVLAPLPENPNKYVDILESKFDGGFLDYLWNHAEYVTYSGHPKDLARFKKYSGI